MSLDVPRERIEQLQEVAEQRKLTIDALLKDMPQKHSGANPNDAKELSSEIQATESEQSPDESDNDYPPGSLARFAQLALKAGLASREPVDTSARSRAMLRSEFADYIDRRIRK